MTGNTEEEGEDRHGVREMERNGIWEGRWEEKCGGRNGRELGKGEVVRGEAGCGSGGESGVAGDGRWVTERDGNRGRRKGGRARGGGQRGWLGRERVNSDEREFGRTVAMEDEVSRKGKIGREESWSVWEDGEWEIGATRRMRRGHGRWSDGEWGEGERRDEGARGRQGARRSKG